MAWTSGTADNYLHLMEILRNYLTANGYTILQQSSTHFYCKGPGLAGLDEIYWGVEGFENSGAGYWNWRLAGSWGHKEGRVGIVHPGTHVNNFNYPHIYLWNQAIPYWIAVNGRRCFLLAKVGTVYQAMYMGLGVPVGTDAQFPYPLVIGGCGRGNTVLYSTANSENAMFFGSNMGNYDLYNGSALIVGPSGQWEPVTAYNGNLYQGLAFYGGWYLTKSFISNLLPALDGSYLLEPIYMISGMGKPATSAWANPTMSLDGILKVSGYNNSAENIISVSGESYLVFPDVYRSTRADYFAVRMV